MRHFTLRQWLILLTVQFATLLFGATMTSVAVILPQMKGALSATQDQVSWIITFNLVATAIATPLTGWLASKLGWRNLMVGAIAGFTTFSVLAGTSESLETMLITRVFQGLFGAPIFPLGQAIILASFTRAQHPFVLMAWGVGGVMGPIIGPMFGGLVAELFNWRWAFYMILPLGIAAILFAIAALSNQEKGGAQKFDYLGFILIAVAIGATQLMFDRGQRLDWLESHEIQLELLLAVVFFYLFVVHTLTARQALFDPAAFADRNFAIGITLATIMGMLQYTPMVLFPPLLQELRGYPDSIVGYLLGARGVGNFLSFFIVVQFTRFNPRLCLFTGLALQAVAGSWMASLDINMTTADVFWSNILHGIGFGTAYTPMAVLTFSTLPMRLLTQGNAVFALLRLLGSSIFIALTLVVYFRSSAEASVNLSGLIDAFDPRKLSIWVSTLGAVDQPPLHLRLLTEVRQQAAMIGYINAFYLLTLASALAAPLAFLFVTRKVSEA
ncbi:MAG: DHA2 family efflux MFS transporter permease subunit [Alphaproteobacteria bacterium]|jgi:DHA2 family multidrug resistance protein|nr:DHA2 family efflux MFS transporter permease subunit [Alphaproteobacteria bacterium]MDP6831743.1 DHA2 family efflux MFS transporter permease subunit [Alphaproteobacteria bacterium]